MLKFEELYLVGCHLNWKPHNMSAFDKKSIADHKAYEHSFYQLSAFILWAFKKQFYAVQYFDEEDISIHYSCQMCFMND